MSEMWSPGAVERVPVWTRGPVRSFAPRGTAPSGAHFTAWAEEPAPAPAPVPDAEVLIAEGYARGLADGRAMALAEQAEERDAAEALIAALGTLRPEPPAALAAVLAETVKRLVAQVVGETEIDAQVLASRVAEIAAIVAGEGECARIRLHPADAARVAALAPEQQVVPDPAIARGSVVAETAAGWIEDGKAVRLEKVAAALDRMGAPR